MAEYAAKQQFSKRKVDCTSTNYSALDKELNDLETELAKIDPSKTKASRLWRDKIAKNRKSEEEVTNLLKEFGVYNEAKEKIINDFCKCRVWCELYPDMCQMESCEIWWALKALSDIPEEDA